jgi:hypothetical protein
MGLGSGGSEIWDPEKPIPYPGYKKGTGARIRIRNTAKSCGSGSTHNITGFFF